MPEAYDPEQLDEAEKAATGPAQPRRDPYSRSTKGGSIRYSPTGTGTKTSPDATSTSTAPGQVNYSADVPEAEQSLYTSSTSDKGRTVFGNFFKNKPRSVIIGGVAGAGIAGAGVALFLALLPLKVLHIVQNLENRYFATSHNAGQKAADSFISSYYRNHVLQGLSSCKGTIDISCKNGPITGKDLISKGFRALAGQDENGVPRFEPFEHQLAREKGIYLKLENVNGKSRYYVSKPGVTAGLGLDVTDLTKEGETLGNIIDRAPASSFNRVSTREFKQIVYKSYQDATFWKKVMIHIKAGRMLETKYAVRRFIPDRPTPIKNAKNSFKIFLAERILMPRSEMLGIAVVCLFDDSEACDIIRTTQPTEHTIAPDGSGCTAGCDTNGQAKSKPELEMQQKLDALAARFVRKFDQKELDALQALFADINKKGFTAYAAEKSFKALFGFFTDDGTAKASSASDLLTKWLPYIGAMDTLSKFVDAINKLPAKAQKFNYVLGSTAMIQMFNMYRSYADQMKHGDVSASMAGTFADSLGPNYVDPNSPDPLGGTAQAETTPLYQTLIGGKDYKAPTNNTLGNLFSPKASAASASSTTSSKFLSFSCKDGKGPPAGKSICPEHNLLQLGGIVGALKAFQSNDIWRAVSKYADLWRALIGPLKALISAIAHALGLDKLLQIFLAPVIAILQQAASALGIDSLVKSLVSWASDKFLPFKMTSNQGGGTNFEMAAGGAEGAGYDYCHTHLGCVAGSDQQIARVWQEQYAQDQFDYQHQSFFARMFDTEHAQSPMVKLAMAMPTNTSSAIHSTVASLTKNPFGRVFSSFGSIFSFGRVQAAPAAVPASIFGHTPYYYPANDPIFSQDPPKFWLDKCVPDPNDPNKPDYTQQWNQMAAEKAKKQAEANDVTATLMPENDGTPDTTVPQLDPMGTNPCLLLQDTVASVAGTRSTAVFAPGDLQSVGLDSGTAATSNGSSSTTPSQAGNSQVVGTFPTVCKPSQPIPAIQSYGYPVQPFDQQHAVRANLNDPRFAGSKDIQDATSKAFHFGVDISAPDGTNVYAIEGGQITDVSPGGNHLEIQSGDKLLAYWHVDFSGLSVGQKLAKGQLIGHVLAGEGHVHLAEAHRDSSGKVYYVNPLRPGALAPYQDSGAPVITSLDKVSAGGVSPASSLSGSVDLSVNAYDIPPITPPSPWDGARVTPAVVQWEVKDSTGQTIMATRTAEDFSQVMCPADIFDQIYASGTLQNGPPTVGNYNLFLIHNWDTTKMQNGTYSITITASDNQNNKSSKTFNVTVSN